MRNPYDRPPTLPKGSSSAEEVYSAVGYALSRWEMLETELAWYFSTLCEADTLAPQVAYGAAIAAATRNSMLQAAASAFYFGDRARMKRALDELNTIGKLSGLRNDIAHGYVASYEPILSPYDGNYLIPPDYQTGKGSRHTMSKDQPTLDPKYQYTAAQIEAIAEQFDEAVKRIRALIHDAMERGPASP